MTRKGKKQAPNKERSPKKQQPRLILRRGGEGRTPHRRSFEFELRRIVRNLDTQELREEAIQDLRDLAKTAYKKAKPGQGKKLNQSVQWARITAYLYQVINTITRQYDERQIDKDLDELERLIDEARKQKERPNQEECGENQKTRNQ